MVVIVIAANISHVHPVVRLLEYEYIRTMEAYYNNGRISGAVKLSPKE